MGDELIGYGPHCGEDDSAYQGRPDPVGEVDDELATRVRAAQELCRSWGAEPDFGLPVVERHHDPEEDLGSADPGRLPGEDNLDMIEHCGSIYGPDPQERKRCEHGIRLPHECGACLEGVDPIAARAWLEKEQGARRLTKATELRFGDRLRTLYAEPAVILSIDLPLVADAIDQDAEQLRAEIRRLQVRLAAFRGDVEAALEELRYSVGTLPPADALRDVVNVEPLLARLAGIRHWVRRVRG